MATSETAPPLVSRSSPPVLDGSPSNASSPLSDVEDKDADADEMDFDLPSPRATSLARQRQLEGLEVASPSLSTGTDGDESMLSDADVNDSEAETERLYDTPPKNTAGRDTVYRAPESGVQLFLERRSRAFEPSPSKLQRQIKAQADGADDGSDNDSLSDADDDDVSTASNELEQDAKPVESRSPSPVKKASQPTTLDSAPTAEVEKDELNDTRKRKRSSAAEQLEEEQPLRKRTGSVVEPERDFSADNTAIIDDDVATPTVLTREPSPEDEDAGEADNSEPKSKDVPTQSIEDTPQRARSKSAKRGTTKKRKGRGDGGAVDSPIDSPVDAGTPAADDDGARNVEDEQPETNADEEAELAQKEEELVERKKAAWEELAAIEKQFTNFRERLYQERLDQLNREEAMLQSPNPTHPEYLAMLACIDARRDERIRVSTIELGMRMDLLKRKAVAERAQIMTQYHQGIRASRERVLEDLGREWYEIQHERRRAANNIPDFGIRLPATKKETLRAAVAYNKEVSILSGVAKYQGFPAAPDIRGARDEEIEGDFEAITSLQQPPPPQQQFLGETPAPVSVQFGVGRGALGSAAEQFLEQTPWANPNHPAHAMQRPRDPVGMAPVLYAGPGGMGRRHSSQQFG
ncbi:hypothetical protein BR93DRAFT_860832, partial [Coniochaeta sp. PMI_546]